ncbi:MAG: glycoside hydrolase family 28 protein [Cyclobacteriaceae bacterium]|nr:glycoside hydrolase family 28 protein [Cyclobacteriaceae bacterium]
MRNLFLFSFLMVIIAISGFAQGGSDIYDPFDYGAKGNGITLDTEAIQAAIDSCHHAGGGKVYLYKGVFISGTIILKNNVTLYIEAGATLKGSNNLEDFPTKHSKHPSYEGNFETNKMLIYSEDAKNISVIGRGIIDGNGDHWVDGPYGFPSFSKRPRIIHFRGCENIVVRDITLYNSASWVQSYQSCNNIVIEGITVDSRENKDIEKPRFADVPGRNTDGLDLEDCQQVRISNCFINSGDDGICIKSFSPNEASRDITITNCIISTNASGIKIGTETAGKIEDITIQNCVVYDTRVDAISIITVDGSQIERINISGITCRNIKGSAIFIRLGNRFRTYRENAEINNPHLKDVIIENIQGTRISEKYGCIIAGIKNIPVENIVLRNINLEFEGGGHAEQSYQDVPQREGAYPNGLIFGDLPAYGFYIRYAKNIILDNIQLRVTNEDERPAIICDEVEQLEIIRLKAEASSNSPELIRLINSKNAIISQSRSASPVPVFLSIYGRNSAEIILQNNPFSNAITMYIFKDGASKQSMISERRLK